MNREERDREQLHAYHDGELSWLGRRRVERRLARDSRARDELTGLQMMAGALQELDAEMPVPDLWEGVRMRLPAVDARREAEASEARGGWWILRSPRMVGAGVAALAAGLALVVGLNLGVPKPGGALRWLDSRGLPVLVLQDDSDATIIWLLDGPQETTSRRNGIVVS